MGGVGFSEVSLDLALLGKIHPHLANVSETLIQGLLIKIEAVDFPGVPLHLPSSMSELECKTLIFSPPMWIHFSDMWGS